MFSLCEDLSSLQSVKDDRSHLDIVGVDFIFSFIQKTKIVNISTQNCITNPSNVDDIILW